MNKPFMQTAVRKAGIIALSCTVTIYAAQSLQLSYEMLRDAVYNHNSIGQIRKLYRAALKNVAESAGAGLKRHYWLGKMEYLMGRAAQNKKNPERAEHYLMLAMHHINECLKEKKFSDGFRLKAEITGQLCESRYKLGKFVYVIVNGRKVKKLAKKAFKLDPQNGKAMIVAASTEIYRPRVYGGDLHAGLHFLREARHMPDIERDDRYNILLGTGIAYKKLGQTDSARAYFSKAIKLYPGNRFVAQQYKQVNGNLSSDDAFLEAENNAKGARKDSSDVFHGR
jgi:tetratricopeptide (TPR) repeat protein